MHQLESYSLATGLRISKMHLEDHFYPLGFDGPYILISSGSGAQGNNYSWYRIVVESLKSSATINGYHIVQCGNNEDYRLDSNVIDLCGKTSKYQYNWLVKNAALVVCNDTSLLHLAGHYNKKVIATFGISHPDTSGAYFGDKNNQIYLLPPEPWTPSYSLQENPKSIDKIMPERIIDSINKMLGLNINVPQTLHIGTDYNFHVLESIPDAVIRPDFLQEHPLNLRLDKGGDENLLFHQVKLRKSTIITNKALPINILSALRPNIENVIYLVEKDNDPTFAKELLRNAIPHTLLSFLPKEEIEKYRFDYMDLSFLDRREKTIKPNFDISGARFRTNKRVFSQGKVYLSYAHLNLGKNIDNFSNNEDDVIDAPEFWEDIEFHYIYK